MIFLVPMYTHRDRDPRWGNRSVTTSLIEHMGARHEYSKRIRTFSKVDSKKRLSTSLNSRREDVSGPPPLSLSSSQKAKKKKNKGIFTTQTSSVAPSLSVTRRSKKEKQLLFMMMKILVPSQAVLRHHRSTDALFPHAATIAAARTVATSSRTSAAHEAGRGT